MQNIFIKFIPSNRMRYDTLGDVQQMQNGLLIEVDNSLSDDAQFLVALHELVETYLCQKSGVTLEQVDHFDMESWPSMGEPSDMEPGDHPDAPYREQHRKAMIVEHVVANMLGIVDYGVIR